MTIDSESDPYWHLTERSGDMVTYEQLRRMHTRYVWAAGYCRNRDVLEVACGVGQGLKILGSVARTIRAGDQSARLLDLARATYGSKVELRQFDAQELPYSDKSVDVIVIAEAIYYLPDVERFFQEAHRVLRAEGTLLVVTANKDLYDFNRSPHSYTYLGVVELSHQLNRHGFSVRLFGDTPISSVSWRQRMFRPLKALAARLGAIPSTVEGRRWLKRIVFGRMVPMPDALSWDNAKYKAPTSISGSSSDRTHKVLLCAATKVALPS